MKIDVTTSDRGFTYLYFVDRYGIKCRLSQSSLATEEAVWFGDNDHCMHLTRAQVATLLPYLQAFVDEGHPGLDHVAHGM